MLSDIAARVVSRAVWHQTRPSNELLHFTDPATYDGRYNKAGEPGVWYASLTERGAWAELFRHWGQHEISPFEVRRRVGRARVEDLAVLDLTDEHVRAQLDVSEEQLVADDWTRCQALADGARRAGYDGILAPSGALPGETRSSSSPLPCTRWWLSTPASNDHPSAWSTSSPASGSPTSSSTASARCTTPSPHSDGACAAGQSSDCDREA